MQSEGPEYINDQEAFDQNGIAHKFENDRLSNFISRIKRHPIFDHSVWPNVVIAIFTVVIAALTYETMLINRTQLLSLELTRQQIKISQDQVKAILDVKTSARDGNIGGNLFNVTVQNVGTTAAQHVYVEARHLFVDPDYVKTGQFNFGSLEENDSGAQVGVTIPAGGSKDFLIVTRDNYFRPNGPSYVLIFGRVFWIDVFGNIISLPFCDFYDKKSSNFLGVCPKMP